MNVFVVDPCRDNRESIAALLRLFDFDPITFADKQGLLDALDEVNYGETIIITETFRDVESLIHEIHRRIPGAEVIICTTQSEEEDILTYESLGMRYCIKPNVYKPLVKHFRSLVSA